MKKLTAILILLFVVCAYAANEKIALYGRVKDAVSKSDITSAIVFRLDSADNVIDSVKANSGFYYREGTIDTLSTFFMRIPRTDSTVMLEFRCKGYKDLSLPFDMSAVGRRETHSDLGTIYMERAPETLKELTVTSTKIKFYNKGDTLVYNADAFQLAEGSMLDALIAQLPGAELNTDGQIKVNGEFVESLLLNGKEFMDGNNNLMLENIGAYTVKDINVYRGERRDDRLKDNFLAPKVLTMDVRLKKEYNLGWTINAQAGYGTDDRYMARLFGLMFSNTSRLTLIGNANNLNDNRRPGRNDTWTPDQMPNGRREYRSGAIKYEYSNDDESKNARSGLRVAQSINNDETSVSRTNFLPGGDTYDQSYDNSHRREINVSANQSYMVRNKKITLGGWVDGGYSYSKNRDSGLSGTFNRELQDITMEMLEGLYSGNPVEALKDVINRNKTRSDGWTRNWNFSASPYFSYKLPGTSDNIYISSDVRYSSNKNELWRDYEVNYGSNPVPAVHSRQYVDNSPNHNLNVNTEVGYRGRFGNWGLGLSYDYQFMDKTSDSYLYALERLEDMGVYGVVPQEYLGALDPQNSNRTRLFTNKHDIVPSLMYNLWKEKYAFMLQLYPTISFVHRKLNYWTNNTDYGISKQNTTVNIGSIWSGRIEYLFNGKEKNGRTNWRNALRYSYRVGYTLPELVDMLDVMTDYDPQNIYLGNPDLKSQVTHRHLVRWQYSPLSHTFTNVLYLGATHSTNTLVRGYTYDTSTGVRVNRMYNVDGDRTFAVTNETEWQFGSKKQFSLSNEADASFSRYNDMIGVNKEQPVPFAVNFRSLSDKFKIGWQFAGQSLSLRCDYINRHTTSKQPDFTTQNAHHVNYGISGVFTLPAGFGISTDFMCYTRRGYGVENLDTTDPVWNLRLSYRNPKYNKWVFMVDGFDMLHQLSNVSYAVTATGRTVTYNNSLPRYVMFGVQYRLNLQPKKR